MYQPYINNSYDHRNKTTTPNGRKREFGGKSVRPGA
jgi:hypothetical protein